MKTQNRIEINSRNISFDIWIIENNDLYIINEIEYKISYMPISKDYLLYDMPKNIDIKFMENIIA